MKAGVKRDHLDSPRVEATLRAAWEKINPTEEERLRLAWARTTLRAALPLVSDVRSEHEFIKAKALARTREEVRAIADRWDLVQGILQIIDMLSFDTKDAADESGSSDP